MSRTARRAAGLLLACLLGRVPTAAADPVTLQATLDPAQVHVGEPAELAVEMDGAQGGSQPQIASTGGLGVRYVGPTTEVAIVNGRSRASITYRYSLTASQPGTFTLGPFSVVYEGQRYDAPAVTLTVLAAGAPEGARGGAVGPQGLRLVLAAPKSEVYVGERLPLTVKLMVGATRVTDLQYPTLPGDGFALEKFPEPEQRREQTVEGVFEVVDFRTVLTALRSGSLTVGPAAMNLSVVVRGRNVDPFFGSMFGQSARPTTLRSEPLALTVLALPDAGRPADFTGAIGRFDFDVTAAPVEVNSGDPVTVRATISGNGNLDSIAPPAFVASDELRVYPVQPAAAPGATKVYEQVVIPQRDGAVTLPELRLSYFDPEARAYRTLTHPPIPLTVRASARPESAPQIVGGVRPPGPAETLGRDLVFIKDAPGALGPRGARLHRSPLFWVCQVLPLGLWLAAVQYDRRRQRLSGDVRYARFTRAGRAARTALAGARAALDAGDRATFYDAVASAIRDYLSAKLDLPPGGVSADAVGARLHATGLPADVLRDLDAFFHACEQARFAPAGDGGADMRHTLERADAIVRALERRRRLARPIAAAWLLVALGALACVGHLAAAAPESPAALFFHGNALYGEERYAEAAAEYERVLAAGHESGNLYFNLGNAYFKAGDVGRAVLDYERARRLIPRDPDLRANLAYARGPGGDPDEPPLWARLLFPLATRASGDELLLWASAAYALWMLLLVATRLAPASERSLRGARVAAGVALVVLGGSAAYRLLTFDLPAYAVVVAREETPVRFEPAASGTPHFQAKTGAVLRVLAAREGWAQVVRTDGRRGWIAEAAVDRL